MLQRAARARGQPAAECPAHAAAADEAEKAHPAVGDHGLGQLVAGQQERLAPRLGQAGFPQDPHEPQARQRRRRRRFDDHRTTGGHGGTDLVNDHVQRMVESAEGQNDADGFVLRKGQAAGRGRIAVHRDLAAGLRPDVFGT